MRAVYAFYSQPFGGGDIRRSKTHWITPHSEFFVLAYSVMKSKSFGWSTVLYCDKYGKELIETFGIKFDKIIVSLDYCEIKKRFWAAGKIYAYTHGVDELGGFEPFIMIDNDAGFHTKPPKHFMKSAYRCQSIHHDRGTVYEMNYQTLLSQTKNEFPFDIFHEFKNQPVRGGNAGVVIMNSELLWSEFKRYSWALMESAFFDKLVNKTGDSPYRTCYKWNVLVEENLLYLLSKRLLFQEPQTVLDCNGFAIPHDIYNPSGYFHIWGRKKDNKYILDFTDKIINLLDSNIVNNIKEYFKCQI